MNYVIKKVALVSIFLSLFQLSLTSDRHQTPNVLENFSFGSGLKITDNLTATNIDIRTNALKAEVLCNNNIQGKKFTAENITLTNENTKNELNRIACGNTVGLLPGQTPEDLKKAILAKMAAKKKNPTANLIGIYSNTCPKGTALNSLNRKEQLSQTIYEIQHRKTTVSGVNIQSNNIDIGNNQNKDLPFLLIYEKGNLQVPTFCIKMSSTPNSNNNSPQQTKYQQTSFFSTLVTSFIRQPLSENKESDYNGPQVETLSSDDEQEDEEQHTNEREEKTGNKKSS